MTRLHPRRFVWLVAAATVVPIVVLTVLGGRVLEQDRAVEAERERETLEVTGLRIALDIDRALGDIEAGLAHGESIVFAGTGFTAPADAPLLYQPSVRVAPFVPPAFVGAEIAEHQHEDFAGAAATYTRLAESPDAQGRAAALLALGRVHRKRGDRERALRAYADLEALGPALVPVVDQPALSRYDVIEPDVFVVLHDQRDIVTDKHVHGTPAIVVEILSHGTRRRDEGLKRRLYERSGVREYWLVDPDHATIAIHRQTAAGRLSAADHLSSDKQDQLSSPLLPGFELALAELFHAGPQT